MARRCSARCRTASATRSSSRAAPDLQGRDYVNGVWGRLFGQHRDWNAEPGGIYRDGPSFENDFSAIQFGVDVFRRERADRSRDHAGGYAAVGWSEGEVDNFDGARAGDAKFNSQSLGAYWTHFGPSGWYLDAVAQGTWYRTKAGSGLLPQLRTDGFGAAASLEGGYPFALGRGWSVEPQAQFVYQSLDLDDAGDAAATVRFRNAESAVGRFGVRLARTWPGGGAASPGLITAWVRGDVWREFSGDPRTEFSSADGFVPFRSDAGGSWGEVNVGFTAQLAGAASFFAAADYQKGFDHGVEAYDAKIGLRFNW